jgi:hypothetical protein
VGGTFVEGHHDIRTQGSLDLNHFFWGEKVPGTVDMRTEDNTLLLDIDEFTETEYLETTAVCQNRTFPMHELVKPSHLFDQLMPGSQVEVIGIPEYDLGSEIDQIL